ncbi:MAG: hypothetical protein MHPSP_001955, partial [Paramarteilia canceri]
MSSITVQAAVRLIEQLAESSTVSLKNFDNLKLKMAFRALKSRIFSNISSHKCLGNEWSTFMNNQ